MRLRAPPGAGDPSVGGVTLRPNADGIYEIDTRTGAHLVEAFGFVDADAPAPAVVAHASAASNPVLRNAVIANLRTIGVMASGNTPDRVLAEALTKAINEEADRVNALVKSTEDRVIAGLDSELKEAHAKIAAMQTELSEAHAKLAASDSGKK